MKSWDEISDSDQFNALPIEQKASVRDEYFNTVIAPKAPKEHIDEVREEFLKRTDKSMARFKRVQEGGGTFEGKPITRKVRPAEIQDSYEFWKDQVKKGFAQLPEFAGTIVGAASDIPPPIPAMMPMYVAKKLTEGAKGEPIDVGKAVRGATRSALDIKDIPATTEAQKLGGMPVQFLAGTSPFSAVNIAKSARKGVTAATEFLSSSLGGFGAEEGGAAGEELGGQPGRVAGTLGGGVAGGGISAMAVPQFLSRGYAAGKAGLARALQSVAGKKGLTQQQLEDIIGPSLAKVIKSDPRAAENLREALEVSGKVTGLRPDLAQATGSTVVRAMKERVSRESEDILSRFNLTSENNKKVLEDFRKASFPSPTSERVQDIAGRVVSGRFSAIEKETDKVKTDIAKSIQDTDDRIAELAAAHAKSPDNTAIGERLIALQNDARKLRFAQTQAQYIPVYELADRMGFQEDISPLVDYVRKTMRDEGQFFQRGEMPSVFRDIMRFAKKKQKDIEKDMISVAFKGKMPDSITQFVAKRGGLNKAALEGELQDVDVLPKGLSVGIGRLVNSGKGSKKPDDMRLLLEEAGYLKSGTTPNDMYVLLEEEYNNAVPTHFSLNDADRAAEILAGRHLDAEVMELAERAGDKSVPVSFREFHSLLKRVNDDMGEAAQRGWRENWLRDLKDQLKSKLSGYEGKGQLAEELKKANQFWLEEWKMPFVKGAGGIMHRDKILEENVVEKAFMVRGERGAEDWGRIYGNNPEAQALLYQGAADSFARSSVKDGKFNLTSAKGWLSSHDKFLSKFPELQDEFRGVVSGVESVTSAGKAEQTVLKTRLKTLNQAKKDLETGELAKITGTTDTPKVAAAAIENPDQMRQLLLLTTGNKQAQQGLATAIADVVIRSGNPEKFMLVHEATLKRAMDTLGPKHYENLQAIIRGDTILERGGDPSRIAQVGAEMDPMQALVGTPSSSLFSLAKGLNSWVSPEYAVFHVAGRYVFKVRREQQRDFLVEVLTNPEVASKIAEAYKDVTPATAEQLAKGAYDSTTRVAMENLRKMKEEVAPMFRLHGIRVTVNAVNEPARVEERQKQRQSDEERRQQALERVRRGRTPALGLQPSLP